MEALKYGRKFRGRPKDALQFRGLFPTRPKIEWLGARGRQRIIKSQRFAMLRRLITDQDDFLGLCMAIGYIAQNWANIEHVFDLWIAMIYHDIGGKSAVNPQIPVSFKRKATFLRRSFNNLAPLKIFAADALPLIEEAARLSKKRNDLIHGVMANLRPIDGKWHMRIFDYDTPQGQTNWHVDREFIFSSADFQSLEAQLVPLSIRVGVFGHRLLGLIQCKP